jgi:uncharacterized Fe-S center protein
MSSKVFFLEIPPESSIEERAQTMKKLCRRPEFDRIITGKDKVAVKMHIGEKGNTTHVSPEVIREVVAAVKKSKGLPFLTETSTLYRGERTNAILHTLHAERHGFTIQNTGAPFIMADGLEGNSEVDVEINGILHERVSIAREAAYADALIAVSHVTGHMASGIGAALKNLGMGLASRKGKMRQHSSVKPFIKEKKCIMCGECIKWCPEDAISEQNNKAHINHEKCIGCGECLTVCNYDAVSHNWGTETAELQKHIAEYALGAVAGKKGKAYFINCLFDMTEDCDCLSKKQEPIVPDIGILGSADPVALDSATLDLTEKGEKKLIGSSWPRLDPWVQIEHGEKIGLGTRTYELLTL